MNDRLSLSQVAALMAYAATTAGGQLLFKTPALRGAGDGPLAEWIAGFLLNAYFFRCAHSLRRADYHSVGQDPELYPALARLSVPRACICCLRQRLVVDAVEICIVLILGGLF
jgi:hypothetical protein